MASFENFFAPQTPLGSNLSGLVTALYSGDPEGKRLEREAMMKQREEAAALKRAQTAQIQAKLDAEKAAQAERSMLPDRLASALLPGIAPGTVQNRGIIQPQAETADMPGIIGGYRDERYTPEIEKRIAERLFQTVSAGSLPGKSTVENVADAEGKGQIQSVVGEALAGLRPKEDAFIVRGNKAFDDSQGRILNFATGASNETGPQARANVVKTGSETTENIAQAGNANASAALSRERINAIKNGTAKMVPGYRWKPGLEGVELEPTPGGPADQKVAGVFNQDTASVTSGEANLDRLSEEADKVLKHPGLKGITGLRGAIPNLPGSAAADAQALLNTLKSQVAFGVLQDMRANSKTGGALGAVSDAEGKRLEANLASLEKAQSIGQMMESLRQVQSFAKGAKTRLRGAYNMRHGNRQPPASAPPTDIVAPPAEAVGGPTVSNW